MAKATRAFASLLTILLTMSAAAEPLDSVITYQGVLTEAGTDADGEFDIRFELFDAETGGFSVVPPVVAEDVVVEQGHFTVELDFGTGAFIGDQLWLELGVREGSSTSAYTVLAPRQKMTPAPYSLYADSVAPGAVGGDQIGDDSITSVDVAPGAITGSELATGSVGAEKIAPGAIGAGQVDVSQIQQRVTGDCGESGYMKAIGESGDPDCGSLNLSQLVTLSSQIRTLDTARVESGIGEYSSIAIRLPRSGADGLPIIAYSGDRDLRVYDCSDPSCSDGNVQVLDNSAHVGRYNDILIRPDGLPMISYYDSTHSELKVYRCDTSDCATGSASVITSGAGEHARILQRQTEHPILVYEGYDQSLRAYSCTNQNCTTGVERTLYNDPIEKPVGAVLRGNGRPLIGFVEQLERGSGAPFDAYLLRVFDCEDAECSGGTIRDVFIDLILPGAGYPPAVAMTITPGGIPLLAYAGIRSGMIVCAETNCASTFVGSVPLGSTGQAGGKRMSMAIASDGNPLVAITTWSFRVVKCGTPGCTDGASRDINGFGRVGDVAIRDSGLPLITFSTGNGTLKLLSCSDSACLQ